jgi:hypothetical protein
VGGFAFENVVSFGPAARRRAVAMRVDAVSSWWRLLGPLRCTVEGPSCEVRRRRVSIGEQSLKLGALQRPDEGWGRWERGC